MSAQSQVTILERERRLDPGEANFRISNQLYDETLALAEEATTD